MEQASKQVSENTRFFVIVCLRFRALSSTFLNFSQLSSKLAQKTDAHDASVFRCCSRCLQTDETFWRAKGVPTFQADRASKLKAKAHKTA